MVYTKILVLTLLLFAPGLADHGYTYYFGSYAVFGSSDCYGYGLRNSAQALANYKSIDTLKLTSEEDLWHCREAHKSALRFRITSDSVLLWIPSDMDTIRFNDPISGDPRSSVAKNVFEFTGAWSFDSLKNIIVMKLEDSTDLKYRFVPVDSANFYLIKTH